MATSIVQDYTAQFNANSRIVIDTNGWDFVVAHIVTPSGSLSFEGTNDSGDIEGSTLGNQLSATNFIAVAAQDLAATASTTYITSTAASRIVRFDVPTQFIRFTGTSITVTKLLIKFHKHF